MSRRGRVVTDTLRNALSRYVYLSLAQLAQTAACNSFHALDARLVRWLLMAHDRSRSDELHLTHEFLAQVLGVRRVGVTNAASTLQKRSLVSYRRGTIRVLDRSGLEAASCSCYRTASNTGKRVLGYGFARGAGRSRSGGAGTGKVAPGCRQPGATNRR